MHTPCISAQSPSKCQYQWSWDKPYSPGCNHLCPMLQFGSKHVGIEDVHIFKHCHEMTGLLLWIGTYCISCVVQQISRVKDLYSLVRYDDSCLAAIRHVQSVIRKERPRPNIRSHSILLVRRNPLFPQVKWGSITMGDVMDSTLMHISDLPRPHSTPMGLNFIPLSLLWFIIIILSTLYAAN